MSHSANALVMKEININLVRRTLKLMREATKMQIAEATGLSTVTVATILQKLVRENIAFDAGSVASMGGRPAQRFRFNENHAHTLVLFTHEHDGLDMLHVRVANLNGECVYAEDAPLTDINLHTFEPYIDAALGEYASIRAIGFGVPGVEFDGHVLLADYPALTGTAFLAHYQGRYGLPLIFENDVNAACIGYCRRNGIESEAATLYLYFPQKYTPGGGIYINGALYKGFSHYAGEVAGMPLGIDWNDATLYKSPERICEAIATLIVAVSHLLNPQSVILYGTFLDDVHLRDIERRCMARQPVNSIPHLSLAADFTLDYQDGIIEQALALLEPQLPITL
jgi:predicted NBD/HSP70 family sugar kinase